jgi:hypothetical protein
MKIGSSSFIATTSSARWPFGRRRFITSHASRRKTAGWFSETQSTKGPICHSKVAIGVRATGVGFTSTSTPRTSKPKLSDWSLWERGDIRGGIVLGTTSLCLRTREVPSSASCRRLTCRAIRAAADIPGRWPRSASRTVIRPESARSKPKLTPTRGSPSIGAGLAFDPLPRRAALVVKGHDTLGWTRQVGHDEADTLVTLARSHSTFATTRRGY